MGHIIAVVKVILNIAVKAVLSAVALLLFVPLAYLAWRASQPMDMPQFDGLTYYQLLDKRRQDYIDLAKQYQASHPDKDVSYLNCFLPELGVQLIGALPNAGLYALAGVYPDLRKHANPQDLRKGFVPEGVTWLTFLPAWWGTYEKFVWWMAEHSPHGPVPYCRIAHPIIIVRPIQKY
jgi:hypothetical protein